MVLNPIRVDTRQHMVYDPNTVDNVFKALQAASLIHHGAALQRLAEKLPADLRDNIGQIGVALWEFGYARQQIQAGHPKFDVPDELIHAQQGWGRFALWLEDPSSVSYAEVVDVVDQIAGALTYMHERMKDAGSLSPRWVARLVNDQPCESCGR